MGHSDRHSDRGPSDKGPSDEDLLDAAAEVAQRAHAPYSGVHVGAALLDRQGRVFVGCNVENVSYGLTQCAERSALCSAIAAGSRELEAIAIHAELPGAFPPCGACRQVLAEFAPDLRLVWRGQDGRVQGADLGALLGHMLRPGDLEGADE